MPSDSLFDAKFTPGFVTMLPAATLTYSSLVESYSIVISAVPIPFEGTFDKPTGTTISSPLLPDTEPT